MYVLLRIGVKLPSLNLRKETDTTDVSKQDDEENSWTYERQSNGRTETIT